MSANDGKEEGSGFIVEFQETMKSFGELREKYLVMEKTNQVLTDEVQELKRMSMVSIFEGNIIYMKPLFECIFYREIDQNRQTDVNNFRQTYPTTRSISRDEFLPGSNLIC